MAIKLKPLSLRFGYKIVSNMHSYIQKRHHEGRTNYNKLRWTERRVHENGKRFGALAVFADLESARKFKKRGWSSYGQIWLCLYQESRCKSMWCWDLFNRKKTMKQSSAPSGTILADFVLLVEKVE